MKNLNLPAFDVKLGGTAEQPKIWDILRRKYVALTPEEWVRQHFIHFLTEHKHYPAALLANEVGLQIGNKQLRADSVLYTRQLRPRMIVEYKAPHIEITQRVFEQIAAYNMKLHVDYLVVSNGIRHFCCKMNYGTTPCRSCPTCRTMMNCKTGSQKKEALFALKRSLVYI